MYPELVTRSDLEVFLPPIGGQTIYIFGNARDLADPGAAVARVSAFDGAAVEQALRAARAEVVIDQLTSLPRDPSLMPEAEPENHSAS